MAFKGSVLRAERLKRGISQRELADLLGVSQPMVHFYETEKESPSVGVLFKIAELISVSTDKLLGLEVNGDAGSVQHEAVGYPI